VTGILAELDAYYDAVPRASARPEEVGPFTLFVRTDPHGFHYYARPRLGVDAPIRVADVDAVRARQRALGVPESLEWVHQTTPSLLEAAHRSGLSVAECPLLVLRAAVPAEPAGVRLRVLGAADADELAAVNGAVDAAFAGRDEVAPRPADHPARLIREGLLTVVAAYDEDGLVAGGGSHSPRGTTTELTGIGVLPRLRRRGVGAAITAALVQDALGRGVRTVFLSAQDDTVARVYQRVGFERVGTACIAEPPAG
jgi:predicted GNAT family acetyltransferase